MKRKKETELLNLMAIENQVTSMINPIGDLYVSTQLSTNLSIILWPIVSSSSSDSLKVVSHSIEAFPSQSKP